MIKNLTVLSTCLAFALTGHSMARAALTEVPCETESPQAKCFTLNVPKDHNAPEKGTYALSGLLLPGMHPEKAPTVLINGGPGQSHLNSYAPYFLNPKGPTPLGAFLLEQGPVVMFDARGSGSSEPDTYCESWVIKDCLKSHPELDWKTLTDQQLAEDLDDLREALGAKTINLFGTSYGSHLALTYLDLHPEKVNWAILSHIDPDMKDAQLESQLLLPDMVKKVVDVCLTNPTCKEQYGQSPMDFHALFKQYQENPIDLELPDGPIKVDGLTLSRGLLSMLSSPGTTSFFPRAYRALQQGNVAPLVLELIGEPYPLMFYAITCQRQNRHPLPEITGDAYQRAVQQDVITGRQECEDLGMPPSTRLPEKLSSAAPVLLISGELDPVTPPEYGLWTQKSLKNAWHVTVPYATHGMEPGLDEQCRVKVMQRFLTKPTENPEDECLKTLPARHFVRPPTG